MLAGWCTDFGRRGRAAGKSPYSGFDSGSYTGKDSPSLLLLLL